MKERELGERCERWERRSNLRDEILERNFTYMREMNDESKRLYRKQRCANDRRVLRRPGF